MIRFRVTSISTAAASATPAAALAMFLVPVEILSNVVKTVDVFLNVLRQTTQPSIKHCFPDSNPTPFESSIHLEVYHNSKCTVLCRTNPTPVRRPVYPSPTLRSPLHTQMNTVLHSAVPKSDCFSDVIVLCRARGGARAPRWFVSPLPRQEPPLRSARPASP